MNLFILFFLLVPPDLQHGSQHLNPAHHHDVHHQCLAHPDNKPHTDLGLKYLKLLALDMFSEILGRYIDPKEPLNNVDLAKFLMNDSFNKVNDLRQNIKEELRLEREHDKHIIDAVVTGFCNRLKIIEECVTKCENNLKHTAEKLENNFNEKGKNLNNLEEKVLLV